MGFHDQLLTASWRGVEFFVTGASETTGRRTQRFDFPGRDTPAHEDMGALDGPIRLTALLIGDDVLDQVETLKQAVRQPGPGRLVHPWAGEFEAVIAPGSLPEFAWDEREGRIARVTLTFERTAASDPQARAASQPRAPQATPQAAAAVWRSSRLLLGLMVLRDLLTLAGHILGLADRLEYLLGRRLRGGVPSHLLPVTTRLRLMAASPGSLADGYAAIGPDLLTRLTPARPPALAGVPVVQGLTARQQQGAVEALIEAGADSPPVLGLPLTAAAAAASQALDYASRDDAIARRSLLTDAAASHARAIAATPAPAGAGAALARAGLWQSAMDLRTATYDDMSQRAGTLPPVRHWQPASGTPALVGLHRLYGDDPATLVGRLVDLTRRNAAIRHPGSLPPVRLEVLDR
jgi:hypothetical protein